MSEVGVKLNKEVWKFLIGYLRDQLQSSPSGFSTFIFCHAYFTRFCLINYIITEYVVSITRITFFHSFLDSTQYSLFLVKIITFCFLIFSSEKKRSLTKLLLSKNHLSKLKKDLFWRLKISKYLQMVSPAPRKCLNCPSAVAYEAHKNHACIIFWVIRAKGWSPKLYSTLIMPTELTVLLWSSFLEK